MDVVDREVREMEVVFHEPPAEPESWTSGSLSWSSVDPTDRRYYHAINAAIRERAMAVGRVDASGSYYICGYTPPALAMSSSWFASVVKCIGNLLPHYLDPRCSFENDRRFEGDWTPLDKILYRIGRTEVADVRDKFYPPEFTGMRPLTWSAVTDEVGTALATYPMPGDPMVVGSDGYERAAGFLTAAKTVLDMMYLSYDLAFSSRRNGFSRSWSCSGSGSDYVGYDDVVTVKAVDEAKEAFRRSAESAKEAMQDTDMQISPLARTISLWMRDSAETRNAIGIEYKSGAGDEWGHYEFTKSLYVSHAVSVGGTGIEIEKIQFRAGNCYGMNPQVRYVAAATFDYEIRSGLPDVYPEAGDGSGSVVDPVTGGKTTYEYFDFGTGIPRGWSTGTFGVASPTETAVSICPDPTAYQVDVPAFPPTPSAPPPSYLTDHYHGGRAVTVTNHRYREFTATVTTYLDWSGVFKFHS